MPDPRARVAPLIRSLLDELGLPSEVLDVVSGLIGGRVVHLVDDTLGLVVQGLVAMFDPDRFTLEEREDIRRHWQERQDAGRK